MNARHLYRTILMQLVTLILVWGYTFLVDQAPFGTQPAPSSCRLAVAYLSLPALGHDPRRPMAPTTQLVARLERIVGRCGWLTLRISTRFYAPDNMRRIMTNAARGARA